MNPIIDAIRKSWFEDQDRIDSLIASVYMFGTFDAHTGVTDELISGGKLSLIRDEELKKYLTGWSDNYKVGSREKSPLKQNISDLNLLRFENILWVHKMNNDFVTLNEQNVSEYIEKTLELIESNIN